MKNKTATKRIKAKFPQNIQLFISIPHETNDIILSRGAETFKITLPAYVFKRKK